MLTRRGIGGKVAQLLRIGLGSVLLLGRSILADTTNDHFLLGYTTAILEQYKIKAGSLKVQDGVILINATDVPAPDRDKITSRLKEIPGVVRVDLVELSNNNLVPSSPAPGPAAGASIENTVPKGVEFFPAGRLFEPLMADPRTPNFSLAYQLYIEDS